MRSVVQSPLLASDNISYLYVEGFKPNAVEAMNYYDGKRVTNKRGLTVTSQRKWVHLYERLWREVSISAARSEATSRDERIIAPFSNAINDISHLLLICLVAGLGAPCHERHRKIPH